MFLRHILFSVSTFYCISTFKENKCILIQTLFPIYADNEFKRFLTDTTVDYQQKKQTVFISNSSWNLTISCSSFALIYNECCIIIINILFVGLDEMVLVNLSHPILFTALIIIQILKEKQKQPWQHTEVIRCCEL